MISMIKNIYIAFFGIFDSKGIMDFFKTKKPLEQVLDVISLSAGIRFPSMF